jgi:hypothetical protein
MWEHLNILHDYEFIDHKNDELVLVTNVISFDQPKDPVLLFSMDANTAYLKRGVDDNYELLDIDADIMARLKSMKNIVLTELLGEKIIHAYDMPVAALEQIEFFSGVDR